MHSARSAPLPEVLAGVITLVREAGARLAAEFARPGGPRGAGDKAPVDAEIETDLRTALPRLLDAPVIAEELPDAPVAPGAEHIWLVDPHDGTSAFHEGHRGSAVSVALLRRGGPVLGVVFAPSAPDRGPDLIAWCEGLDHLLRNGAPIRPDLARAALRPGAVVFLNHRARTRPGANGALVAPARFVSLPSIAYRLARAACGDGVAAVSLNGPGALDYAAGHALLRGAGGVLLDEAGREVAYGADGASGVQWCFGGALQDRRAVFAPPREQAPA